MKVGLDSLSTVSMCHELQKQFSVQLPATLVMDYPTLASLVKAIQPQEAPAPIEPIPEDVAKQTSNLPVSVL
jgi:hypothetical protein